MSYPYIPDIPSSKDRLQGHANLANELVRIIKLEEFSEVLLEGPFGSGKSTVLKIAEEQYPSGLFFTFDSWEVSKENIRRVFLVHLIERFGKELIANGYDNEKVLNFLKGRIRTRLIKKQGLILFVAFLFLLPLPLP